MKACIINVGSFNSERNYLFQVSRYYLQYFVTYITLFSNRNILNWWSNDQTYVIDKII